MHGKVYWRRVRFGLIWAFLTPLTALPRRPGLALFAALGSLAFHLLRAPRERILANTRLIFPQWDAARHRRFASEVFRSLARNGFDFLRVRRYSLEAICRLVDVEGLEHIEQVRRPDRGVVCLSAHLGCWELIPYRMRALGYDVAVVYRRLADRALDRYVAARRRRFGMETYERDEDARSMLRCLRRGALLGILVDQHTRVDSVQVPFLGREAWTPTGAVRLALRTGASMVPIVIAMRPGGRYVLRIGPPVAMEVPARGAPAAEIDAAIRMNTERGNAALGEMILAAKEQWVWFHERWRDA